MRSLRCVAVMLLTLVPTLPLVPASRVFNVAASPSGIDIAPSPFVVDRGDMVTLIVAAEGNRRGPCREFSIERYAERAIPVQSGEPVAVHFLADLAGSFAFSTDCGPDRRRNLELVIIDGSPDPVTIASFAPTSGSTSGGDTISILGTNFQNGATVQFGGVFAPEVVFVGSGRLDAVSPSHAAGSVAIKVTNPGGENVTSTQLFTYVEPPLSISDVTPSSGSTAGGTLLTIDGARFAPGATVTIGGVALLNVTFVGSGQVRGTTPLGPANFDDSLTQDVVLRNPDGTSATLANGFTWILPDLEVESMNPNTGSTVGGTLVTIRGEGFSTATGLAVTFGGVASTNVHVVDAVTLTAVSPAHAAGIVNVVVSASNGSSSAAFTYQAQPRRRSVRTP